MEISLTNIESIRVGGHYRGAECRHDVTLKLIHFAGSVKLTLGPHEIVRLFHARKLMLRLRPTLQHIVEACWDDVPAAKEMCRRHAQCEPFVGDGCTIKYGATFNARPMTAQLDKMLSGLEDRERELKEMQETVKRWRKDVSTP